MAQASLPAATYHDAGARAGHLPLARLTASVIHRVTRAQGLVGFAPKPAGGRHAGFGTVSGRHRADPT